MEESHSVERIYVHHLVSICCYCCNTSIAFLTIVAFDNGFYQVGLVEFWHATMLSVRKSHPVESPYIIAFGHCYEVLGKFQVVVAMVFIGIICTGSPFTDDKRSPFADEVRIPALDEIPYLVFGSCQIVNFRIRMDLKYQVLAHHVLGQLHLLQRVFQMAVPCSAAIACTIGTDHEVALQVVAAVWY